MKAPSSISVVAQRGHSVGTDTSLLSGSGSAKEVPSECRLPSISEATAGPRTSIILGMTSPRRTTLTLSPSWIPRRSTSPLLCSVVFSTVTPDTITGATLETGVTFPVLPVCQSTSMSTVVASSGGNFHARAQRGWCAVMPRSSRLPSLSSLMTMPSISQSAASLLSVQLLTTDIIAALVESSSEPPTTSFPATSMPTPCNHEMISESYSNTGGSGLSGCLDAPEGNSAPYARKTRSSALPLPASACFCLSEPAARFLGFGATSA